MGWDFSKAEDMVEAAFVLLCSSQPHLVPEEEYADAHKKWMSEFRTHWIDRIKTKRELNVRD